MTNLQEQKFHCIFGNVSCQIINSDTDFSLIDQKIIESTYVTMDLYENKKSKKSYFLICIETLSGPIMFIIFEKDILLIQKYFSKFNLLPKFISPKVQNSIENYININQNSTNKYCLFFNKINFEEIRINVNFEYWSIIKKCLLMHLLSISCYNETIKDKVKDFMENTENINETIYPTMKESEYIMLGSIASTNSSSINLAYHINKKKLFIIKIFHHQEISKLREREGRILSNLSFPFIPKIIGYIDNKNTEALAIEYINGQPLSEIDVTSLQIVEKYDILFQVLIALVYLHFTKYVYRDLKPENIIIDNNKRVSLIDYDQSNDIDNNTESFTNLMCSYSAPEVQNGEKYTVKSDIYSFGLLIYYIITSKNIYRSGKINLNEIPENLSGLRSICFNCIQKDPDNRPSGYKLISDLFANCYFNKDIYQFIYGDYLERARQYYEMVANLNYTYAQNNVADFYIKGELVPQDTQKGIYFFEQSAKQNDPYSLYKLGLFYYEGKYVQRDIYKAINYLLLSAKQDYTDAQYTLGVIYSENIFVPVDIGKAFLYFSKADNSESYFKLGLIYLEGKYVPVDIDAALHYLHLAANQNNSDAQYQLGLLYFKGIHVTYDIDRAISYFKKAANQNNANALYSLGNIYQKHYDCDPNVFVNYYKLSANLNNSAANFELGNIYYEGKVVPQNIKKAIFYYEKSASKNNQIALYQLGSIYFEGFYVDRDITNAISYFKGASCFNNPYAKNNLGVIFRVGDGVTKNIENSILFFQEAIKKNDCVSMFNLAHIYIYEKKEASNIDKAIELLINSYSKTLEFSVDLLSLMIIKKYKKLDNFDIKIMQKKDIEKIDQKLTESVIEKINKFNLEEESHYNDFYIKMKDINLVYYDKRVEKLTIKEKYKKFDTRREINSSFYEGLKIENEDNSKSFHLVN